MWGKRKKQEEPTREYFDKISIKLGDCEVTAENGYTVTLKEHGRVVYADLATVTGWKLPPFKVLNASITYAEVMGDDYLSVYDGKLDDSKMVHNQMIFIFPREGNSSDLIINYANPEISGDELVLLYQDSKVIFPFDYMKRD